MAEIKAIKGYRYNPEIFKDLSPLITPPYDVIDKEAQDKFYQANPYNFIRLELGKKYFQDSNYDNVYTRAADSFKRWQQEGIIIQEDKHALYLYQQEFKINDITYIRTGFMCGLKAEDYSSGQVLPHEETLPNHKADRLELMRATQANFSPIFGLYADPEKIIDHALLNNAHGKEPDIEVSDWADEKHRIWVISDENVVNTVINKMKNLKIYIADGHHRYETAAAFGKEMAAQGKTGFDYILINLVNLYDEGLVVLPTHRLVKNLPNFNFPKLLEQIKSYFEVISLPVLESKKTTLNSLLQNMAKAGETSHSFGLYAGTDNLYLLKLKSDNALEQIKEKERSVSWRNLDVTILHNLILENILGIGAKERASEEFLAYTRDDYFAIEAVDQGDYQFSLIMNPPKIEEVTAVAEAGEKMPQKSTFFYPKVISGLVVNKLG
ncbi:MAG: DUF1015 domain-containing protein [Bacillota bacterium]|jgi:uncharacterized protein (DUF1015 family)